MKWIYNMTKEWYIQLKSIMGKTWGIDWKIFSENWYYKCVKKILIIWRKKTTKPPVNKNKWHDLK